MFKVAGTNQSYPYQISVGMIDEKGQKQTSKFSVRFKRVSQDELESIHERLNRQKNNNATADGEEVKEGQDEAKFTDRELIHEVVVGFESGVLDEDGSPLAFNEDNLDRLANTFPCRPAIVEAFFESVNKVLRKN